MTRSRRLLMMCTFPLLLSLCLPRTALAQERCVWVGGNGTWDTASHWSPAVVPGSGDTAVIPLTTAQIMVNADVTVDTLIVRGGYLSVDSLVTLSAGRVVLEDGFIRGKGTMTASERFDWTGGRFDGDGVFRVLPGARFETGDGKEKRLYGTHTVAIEGTGFLRGDGDFTGFATTSIIVSGSLDISNNGQILSHLVVSNGGTVTKIGSFETDFWDVDIESGGTLGIEAGTLKVQHGATLAGSIQIAETATLLILDYGGSLWGYYLDEGAVITGAGYLRVQTGHLLVRGSARAESVAIAGYNGYLSVDSLVTLSADRVVLGNSGFISGKGTMTASERFDWTGGRFDGDGVFRVLPGAVFEMGDGSDKRLYGTHTVVIEGTGLLRGDGDFTGFATTSIIVSGSLELAHSGSVGSAFRIKNGALVTKTGNVTTDLAIVEVDSSGTIAVSEGTVRWTGTASVYGAVRLGTGSVLTVMQSAAFWPGSTVTGSGLLVNSTLGGNGLVNGAGYRPGDSAGMLEFSGRFAPTSDAAVVIEIGNTIPGSGYDRLRVIGVAQLAGTLDARLIDGFSPATEDTFHVVTFTSRTGSFDTVLLPGTGPGDVFDVVYADTSVVLHATGAVTGMTDPEVPSEFALAQNYPNPFNPGTTVSFDVAAHSHVELKVHDILGREIQVLANEELPPGRYSRLFDAGGLPSGTYFYTIRMGQFRAVRVMVLVK